MVQVKDSLHQTFLCFRIDALNTCTLAGVGRLFLTQMWKWMSPVPQSKSTGTHTPALLYLLTIRLTWYRGPFVHGSFTKEALIQPCCFFLGCLSKKKKNLCKRNLMTQIWAAQLCRENRQPKCRCSECSVQHVFQNSQRKPVLAFSINHSCGKESTLYFIYLLCYSTPPRAMLLTIHL